MEPRITLKFCGGTGSVTGANFLLEIAGGEANSDRSGDQSSDKNPSTKLSASPTLKILVDCGLEQGSAFAEASNREPFPYDPSEIDALLITHAHADHIGRIPKLVHDGFRGVIYSTPATLDLAKVMLPDTLNILQEDARKAGVLPLYEKADVEATFKLWKTVGYYTSFDLVAAGKLSPTGVPALTNDASIEVSVYIKDSGHILGSAMYEISVAGKKVVFTGDLGNSPALFLRDTDSIAGVTHLIMESVYGDRNHESKEERRQKLAAIISDTAKRNRTLIIPTFSLERTQDILFEIDNLLLAKQIPEIKVFLDSPLATSVTGIYERYTADFNHTAKARIARGEDIFNFPKLKFVGQRHESERLDLIGNPKIIMAGSGMSNGGRIIRHEKHYLPDPNTTILLVGYQAVGTLGRQIQDGLKKVIIEGETVAVRAEVQSIDGYSSHKDSDHLIDFVGEAAGTLKKVFVTMGEPKSALFLVQRLRDYLGVDATAPKKGDEVEIS
jgi:metallo-beta-lactamase family protein